MAFYFCSGVTNLKSEEEQIHRKSALCKNSTGQAFYGLLQKFIVYVREICYYLHKDRGRICPIGQHRILKKLCFKVGRFTFYI